MAESIRNFAKGQMNKDFDERLVQPGQYRDALNIEVSTAEGSDVGALRNILGNAEMTTIASDDPCGNPSKGVAKVSDDKTNDVYWFIAAPDFYDCEPDGNDTYTWIDRIVKFNLQTGVTSAVVTDHYRHTNSTANGVTSFPGAAFNTLAVSDGTKYRRGMEVVITDNSNNIITPLNFTVQSISGNTITFSSRCSAGFATGGRITAHHPDRVLNFSQDTIITGINIIDDILLWTDNVNEPRKINITRSIEGTPSFNLHTQLKLRDPFSFGIVYSGPVALDGASTDDLKLQDVTVIKRGPRAQPVLEMARSYRSSTEGLITLPLSDSTGDGNDDSSAFINNGVVIIDGTAVIGLNVIGAPEYYAGDELILMNYDNPSDPLEVRVKIDTYSAGTIDFTTLAMEGGVNLTHLVWEVELVQESPMFQKSFGRFGYRYIYEDNETSPFSPWSEIAFLPGDYDYEPKKGFNLGMQNELRKLTITNFVIENSLRPDEVKEVEILYKTTDSPTVYIVKTIGRTDNEWSAVSTGLGQGVVEITSEMIHKIVPSNQILRPWDNVPRKAKAQEVSGGRTIYGNYLQGYDMGVLAPVVRTTLKEATIPGGAGTPMKSMKSIRDYRVGIVFCDKYGRETPVFSSGTDAGGDSSNVSIPKRVASKVNGIKSKLHGSSPPPTWAEFYKFYIKETSSPYYNLAMDRWYPAEDGNIWLSFQSSDRNKIDEDTYLILKNEHGGPNPVTEEGRYKVLAVESDAPLFIKTNRSSHGAALTNIQNGLSLSTSPEILVDQAVWTAAYGANNLFSDSTDLFARIVAFDAPNVMASSWKKIVLIKLASGDYIVRTDGAIGPSADATGVFANPVYSIEIREDNVTNKPEFDGRFFVKVYKDLTLEEKVLGEKNSSGTSSLLIKKTFKTRFLEGYDTLNTHSGSAGALTASVTTYVGTSWTNPWGFNSSKKFGYCGGKTPTRAFWIDQGTDYAIDMGAADYYNYKSGNYLNANLHPGGNFQNRNKGITSHGSYSRMWFRTKGWSGDRNTLQKDFFNTMKTSGTLFRWRDDPGQVTYEVIGYVGSGNLYNHVKYTSTCNSCPSSWSSCKSFGFAIQFYIYNPAGSGGLGQLDKTQFDPTILYRPDMTSTSNIDILVVDNSLDAGGLGSQSTDEPAVWETEPKENVGLDIYYEATENLPIELNSSTNEIFAPVKAKLQVWRPGVGYITSTDDGTPPSGTNEVELEVASWSENVVAVKDVTNGVIYAPTTALNGVTLGDVFFMTHPTHKRKVYAKTNAYWDWTGGGISVAVAANVGYYRLNADVWRNWVDLEWFNCYSFANGVESNGIRDDFNTPRIDNGVKVSATLETKYQEERRKHGLIFSGLYNSTSGVNNLNEFIQAEPITKDLNPSYGSIQILKTKNTDLITFCEDRVLSILTNKDAIFNADGNSNVTSSSKVLGQATPFTGDYGCSNPESLAWDNYTMFFADRQRGYVLRLEGNSIKPISDNGMKDFFKDSLVASNVILGGYDNAKEEYNITLVDFINSAVSGGGTPSSKPPPVNPGDTTNQFKVSNTKGIAQKKAKPGTTVSWSDASKGWVSFKSFLPDLSMSLNNTYYSLSSGELWLHHQASHPVTSSTINYNSFYGVDYYSSVTVVFNDAPETVKHFQTINYEGTQAAVVQNTTDGEYYNNLTLKGWSAASFVTNLADGNIKEFINKEGKWFNHLMGTTTTNDNVDTSEFSVQGIGNASAVAITGGTMTPKISLIITSTL